MGEYETLARGNSKLPDFVDSALAAAAILVVVRIIENQCSVLQIRVLFGERDEKCERQGAAETLETDNPDGTRTVVVSDTLAVDSAIAVQRFMRIRVISE